MKKAVPETQVENRFSVTSVLFYWSAIEAVNPFIFPKLILNPLIFYVE